MQFKTYSFRQGESERSVRVDLYKRMRAVEFPLREQQLRETEVHADSFNEPQDDDLASTGSKIHNTEPYRRERRRIDTAARWNDIQMALGWGGVLFNNWMSYRWFNARHVSKEEWSKIVEQLQSVWSRFSEIIANKIPEFSPILLSRDITC